MRSFHQLPWLCLLSILCSLFAPAGKTNRRLDAVGGLC